MTVEFELKLRVPAERMAAVEGALKRGRVERQRLKARYFDLPDDSLAAHGIALRLRQENGRWIQTAKGQTGRPLERLEHNVPLPGAGEPAIDPARHAATPVGKALQAALAASSQAQPHLRIVYATDVERLARLVTSGKAAIEVALDRGKLRCGERTAEIAELEFEVKRGSPAAAVELASRWCRRHGLWLDTVSKSERGARLARGDSFSEAVVARTPPYTREASGQQVFAAIVGECLRQVLGNASDLAAGCTAAEHVHQLRVGLRRLRTALRELHGLGTAADAARDAVLARTFRDLGQHRDLLTVAPALQRQMVLDGAPALEWGVDPKAIRDPGELVRAPEFQATMHGLLALTADAGMGSIPPADARQLIRDRLQALHRKAVAQGRKFVQLDEAAQHRVRKRFKRLRYLAEFARPLFAARKVDAFVDALKPVQEALGAYVDELAAYEMWSRRAAEDPAAWFGAGWLAARRAGLRHACQKACRAFGAEAVPFWE